MKHAKLRSDEEQMLKIWNAGCFTEDVVTSSLRRLDVISGSSKHPSPAAFVEEEPDDERDPDYVWTWEEDLDRDFDEDDIAAYASYQDTRPAMNDQLK